MTPIHAKSPCCGALVRHFGKRRRQCTSCKRTWRIQKKKRGRKHIRHIEALLKRILTDGHTLAQEKQNFHGLKAVSVAARFAQALRRHIDNPMCPSYVRKHVLEFFEREQDFRAYLTHPHLHLPSTTSAMESTGRLVRKATRTARTPESLCLRATAYLRLKQSVACNGFDTPN